MTYDENLAQRVRELIDAQSTEKGYALTEMRMFGGLAFLLDGHLAVAASQDGLMVRVDPPTTEDLLATTDAQPMVMRGRPMSGWLRVPAEHLRTEPQLTRWVGIGTAYAASLPPKPA